MATSGEIEKKRRKRALEKRRKQKKTIILSVILIIIIILSAFYVKSILENFSKNNELSIEDLVLYPEAPKKTTDILASVPNNDGQKVCYLTFDDGPTTSVTPQILDILRRYDIKATFFMVGSLIEKNPGIAYRVYKEGHLLANHSYRHNYSYLYENKENFMSEINETHSLICDIVKREDYSKIFRFPGGSYNSGSYGEKKQEFKEVLAENGYRFCDWNALNGDAEYKSPSVSTLLNRIKSSSSGKEDLVILMHDSATKKINIQALPVIIEYLLENGYTFDTLKHAP